MSITIYHNPKCSKSRKAVENLTEMELDFEVIEYLKTGLNKDEIIRIKTLLRLEVNEFFRSGDQDYRDLEKKNPTENELINLLIEYPKFLQRPIIINGEKAVIARPSEKINDLF